MARAVSRRRLTAGVGLQFQVTQCGICGVQNYTGPGLTPCAWFWHLSILFHQCTLLIY
jgi:hypothetical protein